MALTISEIYLPARINYCTILEIIKVSRVYDKATRAIDFGKSWYNMRHYLLHCIIMTWRLPEPTAWMQYPANYTQVIKEWWLSKDAIRQSTRSSIYEPQAFYVMFASSTCYNHILLYITFHNILIYFIQLWNHKKHRSSEATGK